MLIFDDANIEQAMSQIFALKYRHAGQACITANRIYVQSGIFDKFLERWNQETQKIVVGHGSEKSTTMGPVTTPRGVEKALALVNDAKSKGATVHLGGNKISKDGGYFFEPTVITGITPEMDIANEEIFAPVSTFIKFETEEEAVKKANDTSMGLASYCFTKNVDRTWRLFENLEAGMIGLNTGKLREDLSWESADFFIRKFVGSRKPLWRDQAKWLWERVRERCRCFRISDHENRYFYARGPVVAASMLNKHQVVTLRLLLLFEFKIYLGIRWFRCPSSFTMSSLLVPLIQTNFRILGKPKKLLGNSPSRTFV